MTTIGDRAFALDAVTVLVVLAGIVAAADRLVAMTIAVPLVLGVRHLAWSRLPLEERGHGGALEAAFVLACTGLGAFNDWMSVVVHGVYDYGVPVLFPEWSTIPIWMLLFWGMILRFFYTLARWRRLGPPHAPSDATGPALRVALLLALTLATRQAIYRWYLDPVLSWAPFAAAIGAYAVVFRPGRHDRTLFALAVTVGPLVEIACIRWGGLHRYHLGWLAGVPLWIALWWGLAVLVWHELAGRALRALATRKNHPNG